MKIRSLSLLMSSFLLIFSMIAHTSCRQSEPSLDLELTWTNPDRKGIAANIYYLDIVNKSELTFTRSNWRLFFNSIHGFRKDDGSGPLTVSHVNGDLYILDLAEDLLFKPGDTLRYTVNSYSVLFKYSSLPGGFFVEYRQNDSVYLSDILSLNSEGSITESDAKRSPRDIVPLPTALSRFEMNQEQLEFQKQSAPRKILPSPVSINTGSDIFKLQTKIYIESDEDLDFETTFLEKQLSDRFTVSRQAGSASEDATLICMQLSDTFDNDESYSLTLSNTNGINILASTPAAVFYAVQSFLSLIDDQTINTESPLYEQQVTDSPRFPYRGLHVDVARNWHSLSEMKTMIDLMAMYKMNRLHLHLTDDEAWRIEIKALPELTEVGARRGWTEDESNWLIPQYGSGPLPKEGQFFSQEDYRSLLAYARDRHITVVPEVDVPGHARAAIKSMEKRYQTYMAQGQPEKASEFRLIHPEDSSVYRSIQNFKDNVVDVGLPSTYAFLKTVATELSAMHAAENVPLEIFHLGGDEVPNGVWEKSPACQDLQKTHPELKGKDELFAYFFLKNAEMLHELGIQLAGWEEIGMHGELSSMDAAFPKPLAYTWNSVWGWEREYLAYELADEGMPVVLCNVTNLYFDLAYDKSAEEAGLYWGGLVDTRTVFEFTPLDVRKCAWQGRMGQAVPEELFAQFPGLTESAEKNILGLQGQLWSERLRTPERLHYMAFPKMLALAERAWAPQPAWATIENDELRQQGLNTDWASFAGQLGRLELKRLDSMSADGIQYRIPLPGLKVIDEKIHANSIYPGLIIRYSSDGNPPNENSDLYTEPLPYSDTLQFACFSSTGRSSRPVSVTAP